VSLDLCGQVRVKIDLLGSLVDGYGLDRSLNRVQEVEQLFLRDGFSVLLLDKDVRRRAQWLHYLFLNRLLDSRDGRSSAVEELGERWRYCSDGSDGSDGHLCAAQ
jgi:hypothetical protein